MPIVISGVVGALLLLCIVVWLRAWWSEGSREKNLELARISEAGEPITVAELASYCDIPSGELDATGAWLRVMRGFDGPRFDEEAHAMPILGTAGTPPLPGEPWPDIDKVGTFLANYRSELDALRDTALAGGSVRLSSGFPDRIPTVLDNVQAKRTCARLLELEAYYYAHRDQWDQAARSLSAMHWLANSLRYEPSSVTHLVRTAFAGIACNALEKILPHADFSEANLSQLQLAVRCNDFEDGLKRVLIGERVTSLIAVEDPHVAAYSPESYPVLTGFLSRDHDAAFFLKTMRRLIEATNQPWPQRSLMVQQIENDVQAIEQGSALTRARYAGSSMCLPSTVRLSAVAQRSIAMQQIADATLAIERYRISEGRLPATLEQLTPEFLPCVQSNPYGQPLQFVVESDHYAVFIFRQNSGRQQGTYSLKDLEFIVPLDPDGKPVVSNQSSSTE